MRRHDAQMVDTKARQCLLHVGRRQNFGTLRNPSTNFGDGSLQKVLLALKNVSGPIIFFALFPPRSFANSSIFLKRSCIDVLHCCPTQNEFSTLCCVIQDRSCDPSSEAAEKARSSDCEL